MKGAQPEWLEPPSLSIQGRYKSPVEIRKAQEILQENAQVGAVKKVPFAGTKQLVPWFII